MPALEEALGTGYKALKRSKTRLLQIVEIDY